MTLAFNNDHIIYYQMDALQSMGLALTYFTHPDYFVVHWWVHDTINQTGFYTYYCVKFFKGRVGYAPLGSQCTGIMAIIVQSNVALSFVITACPAL